jgi:hypothetical protein
MALNISPAMEDAWHLYLSGLTEIRENIYASPFARSATGQAEAHYLFHQLQAVAFNLAIAPLQHYPRFNVALAYEPLTYNWGGPCADFLYRFAFLDGSRTYRIWGERGSTPILDILALNGFWNDPADRFRPLGSVDVDSVRRADGGFEILVSADPAVGAAIQLDPASANNTLLVREFFVDWESEAASTLRIEALDDGSAHPVTLSEAVMIERMAGAVRFMKTVLDQFSWTLTQRVIDTVGLNVFSPSPHGQSGAKPAMTSNTMAFKLDPGEALIVELEIPNPKYWSIQLQDNWAQTKDYVHHQSGLNGRQAVADRDGRVRAVLSLNDPEVANWLDPVGSLEGSAITRWFMAKDAPKIVTRRVGLADLRAALPAETVWVKKEQRAAALATRRMAALRRYHA